MCVLVRVRACACAYAADNANNACIHTHAVKVRWKRLEAAVLKVFARSQDTSE